jgi:hypothetical protein
VAVVTNNCIFHDARVTDEERRRGLYGGQLYVYSPRASTLAFAEFTRELVREAFGALDPETAQHHMPVEDYAALLGRLKPAFIHHPESKRHVRAILGDLGCDLERTYFDVPRLRTSTSDDYLTTGIAYAWHPHRDTWYSAPPCQVNIWMPVYELEADNGMAFHPRYWSQPVSNSSSGYNYYLWNQQHRGAGVEKLVKQDDRPLPKPTEPVELDPQIRIVLPVGGLVFFSGAQMHSSVPNTTGKTRFSVDFRTVHLDDVKARRGAPNVDSASTGTTMRDYLRGTDLAQIPEDIVALYNDGTEIAGKLRYENA